MSTANDDAACWWDEPPLDRERWDAPVPVTRLNEQELTPKLVLRRLRQHTPSSAADHGGPEP